MTIFLLSLILIVAPMLKGSVNAWAFMPLYILTLIILALGIFKLLSYKEIRIRRTSIDIPLLLFFIISLIAIFNSKYIYGSVMEIVKLISLAIIFYIAVNFIKHEDEIKKILNVILISATGIALFGILQYIGVINKFWWSGPKFLSATYVNHNHFAGYMELVIPLSIGMILLEGDISKRVFYIYCFLILSIAFLLSMSRGGWLSLSISILFMSSFVFKRNKTKLILSMIVLLGMALIIFIFNAENIGIILKRIASYKELDFSGRLEIWKGTLGMIKNNFLLGIGPGTFIYNFPKYRPMGINMLVNYAHNDYLQLASEFGVLAAGIVLFTIYRIIRKGLRTHTLAKTPFKSWISLSLTMGVLSMSIHGFGDFNFYIPANIILFTIFSGLIFNISSTEEKSYHFIILKPGIRLAEFLKIFIMANITVLIIFLGSSFAAEICLLSANRAILKNEIEYGGMLAKRTIRLCPFNYIYHYNLANMYAKRGDLERAEEEYKKALQLNSIDGWSWIGLADVYYELFLYSPLNYKLSKLSSDCYRKSLELDPLNSYYIKKFAAFLLNTENSTLASQMYRKASSIMSRSKTLSLSPAVFTNGEAYEVKANQAFASQDFYKALIFYQMTEEFGSEKERAILGQLRCYMKMGSLKKAVCKYKEVLPSNKSEAVLFASLSDYCLRKDLIESAERFSEMAIALDSNNPESYQARYKISKKLYSNMPINEIKDILNFNKIPMSLELKSGKFELGFDIKENMNKRSKSSYGIVLPAGIYEFHIKAKGRQAVGIWPHMVVKFNDKNVVDTYISETGGSDDSGIISVDYPVNMLDIIYDNDYYNPENNEDRNLYIDKMILTLLY